MGCGRGGLTTKIHAVVDAVGPPVRLMLTAGQVHDNRGARELLVNLGRRTVVLAGAPS
jgi:transposase